jgi:hypothetical protein
LPLTFKSINQGRVAFGFFNIESDMLLLEHYFFFAADFCDLVNDLAHKNAGAEFATTWSVFKIERRCDVGDLMGAISGERHLGFIGDTYLRYPFPRRPEDFKQNPTGNSKQIEFAEMIVPYATRIDIPIVVSREENAIVLGDYQFAAWSFCALVSYVWRGGYPHWKGDSGPEYVTWMKAQVDASEHWLFEKILWNDRVRGERI